MNCRHCGTPLSFWNTEAEEAACQLGLFAAAHGKRPWPAPQVSEDCITYCLDPDATVLIEVEG